jgi:hypothetical protein
MKPGGAMLSSRRKVLITISQLIAAGGLAACGGADTNTQGQDMNTAPSLQNGAENDLQLLAGVAYDLFPFEDLDPMLYVTVAQRVLDLESPAVAEALTILRDSNGTTPWLEVDETQRIESLRLLEQSAFFGTMRATAIEVLFRDPEVFALLGYGGSAIEQGGYINRGFADITWLPEGK